MSIPSELQDAVAQTHLSTDGCGYIFLRFPLEQGKAAHRWLLSSNTSYFCALRDDKELSIMMKQEQWKIAPSAVQNAASVSPLYKRITFDIVLEFDLVGYLNAMAQVLASINIPILTFSAFSRDHIFVQQADFERAYGALQAFILYSNAEESSTLFPKQVSKK
jgi:hypothetical protein